MMGLTHLPLNKMATILSDNICKGIFVNENDKIPIQITLKFALSSPIDNKTALVQVMRQTIIWNNVDLIHWRIYAALRGGGGDELIWEFHCKSRCHTGMLIRLYR